MFLATLGAWIEGWLAGPPLWSRLKYLMVCYESLYICHMIVNLEDAHIQYGGVKEHC